MGESVQAGGIDEKSSQPVYQLAMQSQTHKLTYSHPSSHVAFSGRRSTPASPKFGYHLASPSQDVHKSLPTFTIALVDHEITYTIPSFQNQPCIVAVSGFSSTPQIITYPLGHQTARRAIDELASSPQINEHTICTNAPPIRGLT